MSKKNKSEERAARAAQVLREQEAKERRRNVLIILGVVVAMIAIIGGGFAINSTRDSSKDIDADPAGTSDHSLTIGSADAPRQVVIYEDFLCPYCAQLEAASRDDLARLADEGRVQVDYRPFNLLGADYSIASANAFAVVLDAAGPEVAKEFHDLLFENQPSEAGPFPDDDWLVEKAVEAGATEDDVRPGIEDLAMQFWVDDATKAAAEAGINSTPTVLLDGTIFNDGRTMDEIAANLVAALEE